MSRRTAELVVVAAVVGVAAWLRAVHLGTPSLWWDELIQIRTADRPLADVLDMVRHGVSFGAGNAGAMPADYLLLHGWLRATSIPSPELLEAYFRTPAFVASVLAVPALHGLGRTAFGRATGALAAWLLALSLPAILYAAEARGYSLLTLATIVSVTAFARVVRAPTRPTAWLGHLAASLLVVFTGIFGVFVVGAQYAMLGVTALGRSRGGLGALVASAAVLAMVVGRWLAGTGVGETYPRNAVVEPLAVAWTALRFFAADARALVVGFGVGLPLAILAARRRGTAPVAWVVALAFAALPAIALVIRWKQYYFHARHVVFLLPLFHLVVAAGAIELMRRLDPLRRLVAAPATRRALEAAALGALALVLALPSLHAFAAAPQPYFARTKTLRDVRPLTRDLAGAVATLPPRTPLLVLAERDNPANAVLTAYLRWYGIADRVTLRSPGVPLDQVEPLLGASGGNPAPLKLRPAHGLFFGFRSLLDMERQLGDVPHRVSHWAVIGWATPQHGPGVRRYWNASLRLGGAPVRQSRRVGMRAT